MKLYWHHFIETLQQSSQQAKSSDIQLISSMFPNIHFIWITRRDKIRQAVSWAKAMQGVPWIWDKPERYVPEQELEFKFEVMEQFIEETILHEAAWQAFFSENRIKPYTVVYEDFVHAYQETIHSVLRFLRIPISPDRQFEEPKLKQQADSVSDEWVDLYEEQKEREWKAKGWRRIGY